MRTTLATVQKIEGKVAILTPPLPEGCMHCASSSCEKRYTAFRAYNKEDLPIKVGDTVAFSCKKSSIISQSIVCIIFPTASAFLAYSILQRLHASEGVRAGASLLIFFIIAALITLIKSHGISRPVATITQVFTK